MITIVFKENNGNIFTFPVTPSEVKLSTSKNNQTYNIHSLGEINLPGNGKLSTFTFSSFFPSKKYPFAVNNHRDWVCVDYILGLQKKSTVVRVLVTDTNINELFMIDSFEYGVMDGSGDVEFTLTLKQYIEISTFTTTGYTTNKPQVTGNNNRPPSTSSSNSSSGSKSSSSTPKTHTVRQGDTLSSISKMYYGTTGEWKTLYELNKNLMPDPNTLQVGWQVRLK